MTSPRENRYRPEEVDHVKDRANRPAQLTPAQVFDRKYCHRKKARVVHEDDLSLQSVERGTIQVTANFI